MLYISRCVLIFLAPCWPHSNVMPGDSVIVVTHQQRFDLMKLRGKWRIDRFTACDQETGEIKDLRGGLKHTLLIPADNTMSIEIQGVKVYEWAVDYHDDKTPVWIDLIPKLPNKQKKKMSGLIRLDGNTLTVHLGELGSGKRPRDFRQEKGLSSILIECRSIK